MPSPSKVPEQTECPNCGNIIRRVEFTVAGRQMAILPACDVCVERDNAEQEARKMREERERRFRDYNAAFPVADVGPGAEAADLSTFVVRPGTEKALGIVRRYLAQLPKPDPAALVLWGPPGNGKSHMVGAIARRARADLLGVAWVHAPTWLRKLGTLENYIREDQIRMASKADLLVMDDLGAGKLTPSRAEWLLSVIDARYVKRLPIVITTNLSPDQLTGALTPIRPDGLQEDFTEGARVVDRLAELALFVQNEGSSYRQEMAARRIQAMQGVAQA